ncbi:hypothetical protein [Franconibacter helveticus]|uniref:hypothetical protein n=1 Tax=Franconibacter helveticus TaxID=357240 RepID=UPI00128D4023|nr:hypothetical protein [Franconibacter helveticus]
MTEKQQGVNRKIVNLRDEYSANVKNLHVEAKRVKRRQRRVGLAQKTKKEPSAPFYYVNRATAAAQAG